MIGIYILSIVVLGMMVESFLTFNPWVALAALGLVVIYMFVEFKVDHYKIDY